MIITNNNEGNVQVISEPVKVDKEEYDHLKWQEHEYTNLISELEELIDDATYSRYSENLCYDDESQKKLNNIFKRYVKQRYEWKIEEEKENV